jgi:hypothetical protein
MSGRLRRPIDCWQRRACRASITALMWAGEVSTSRSMALSRRSRLGSLIAGRTGFVAHLQVPATVVALRLVSLTLDHPRDGHPIQALPTRFSPPRPRCFFYATRAQNWPCA